MSKDTTNRSGSTTLSYWNCVITLVGSWWGQSIAHAFTRCMMKNIYICEYISYWQIILVTLTIENKWFRFYILSLKIEADKICMATCRYIYGDHSKSSKCHPDFWFVTQLLHLYGSQTEIWTSFSSFIRNGSVLPQQ